MSDLVDLTDKVTNMHKDIEAQKAKIADELKKLPKAAPPSVTKQEWDDFNKAMAKLKETEADGRSSIEQVKHALDEYIKRLKDLRDLKNKGADVAALKDKVQHGEWFDLDVNIKGHNKERKSEDWAGKAKKAADLTEKLLRKVPRGPLTDNLKKLDDSADVLESWYDTQLPDLPIIPY